MCCLPCLRDVGVAYVDWQWIGNGSLMDWQWIGNGSTMDPQWNHNGSAMDLQWIGNGSLMDWQWISSGSAMDPQWIGNGSAMCCPHLMVPRLQPGFLLEQFSRGLFNYYFFVLFCDFFVAVLCFLFSFFGWFVRFVGAFSFVFLLFVFYWWFFFLFCFVSLPQERRAKCCHPVRSCVRSPLTLLCTWDYF